MIGILQCQVRMTRTQAFLKPETNIFLVFLDLLTLTIDPNLVNTQVIETKVF